MISDPSVVEAIIFDLDDTLYLQADWLAGAWAAVAEAAVGQGVDSMALAEALVRIASEGSDRGGIIDRGLVAVGHPEVMVPPLVDAFLNYQAKPLNTLAGVDEMLAQLRVDGIGVAIVTDGALSTQRSKVAALGLTDRVDFIVMSDELGRQYRKPHPKPILEAMRLLHVKPNTTVMIGDRPEKDVAAAAAAGVRTVRVSSGEYCDKPDHPFTWRTAPDAVSAVVRLREEGLLVARAGSR